MNKVYLVMNLVRSCGEEYGPDVEFIFDSEENAIKYIKQTFGNVFFAHNSETGEYSHEPDDYTRIIRWVDEMEVHKDIGGLNGLFSFPLSDIRFARFTVPFMKGVDIL